jgi:hypothetical protein
MSRASSFLILLELKDLKTHTGSKITRSKYGVGKAIGDQLYFHKDYVNDIVPPDVWKKANKLLPKGFIYNTLVYNPKKGFLRFDEAPNFDYAREPIPGETITVDYVNGTVGKLKSIDSIWHHKWLWVKDDYKGFNVNKSKEWSRLWTSKFKETAVGRDHLWKEQLTKYGLK